MEHSEVISSAANVWDEAPAGQKLVVDCYELQLSELLK